MSFIDFSKAYDRINREPLWVKLENMGVTVLMYSALKSLYANVCCAVRINGFLTNWFDVSSGLKQGCILSPLLFNMYVNDLITEVNALDKGVNIGDHKVSLLVYADDIALMADSEANLQCMLDALYAWSTKWGLLVNNDKSPIVHFRNPSVPKSNYVFMYGTEQLHIVSQYKYMGLILTECLDYNVMSKMVSKAASRALGLLIAKSKAYGGMPYQCFTKCFDALVRPIINYGASIWGTRSFSCIEAVLNRACRFFMGLGRYAPNCGIQGDMGWAPVLQDQWAAVTRQWCRLANMNNNRITKYIFIIYIQYILYSLVLILYLKCGGWGMFFLHFVLFPTFLEKQILGIKKYIKKKTSFSFNIFFIFFMLDLFPTFLEFVWKY